MNKNNIDIIENVKVYCRLRPATFADGDCQCSISKYSQNGYCTYCTPVTKKEFDFKFDGVLGTETSQEEVGNPGKYYFSIS